MTTITTFADGAAEVAWEAGAASWAPLRSALAAATFDPRGPVAEDIADLWWLMLALGAAVFLVVGGLVAGALFRRRRGGEDEHHTEPPSVVRRWVLMGGVVMPLVVLTLVFGATLETLRDLPNTVPDDALVVEIVGHQWWWEVHYPDEGVTTANEVHIPVGRPVAFRLTSADVIHSFWVPALGGKLDLLPDGVNTLVLEADEAGAYASHCAEFCGLQHARMGLTVVAEPAEQFASWVAGQRQPAGEPVSATARRGREIFFEAGCASCHTIAGTAAEGTEGPDLTHLASRPTLGAGAVPNTPSDLASWVTDPHTFKSGVEMPAVELPDEDRDALVVYLEGLG